MRAMTFEALTSSQHYSDRLCHPARRTSEERFQSGTCNCPCTRKRHAAFLNKHLDADSLSVSCALPNIITESDWVGLRVGSGGGFFCSSTCEFSWFCISASGSLDGSGVVLDELSPFRRGD